MLALVLGDAGPELRRDFQPKARGEVRIRLALGGVCATDLELLRGYMGHRGVLGHEWVGVALDGPAAGKRVVGGINCACGACPTCLAGRRSHCPNRTVLGIDGRDGAFSTEFTLPAENLVLVPDGVSDEAAVFVEPLAAALQILEQVAVRPSQRVVVLGAGRLGQLCVRVLALTGAEVELVARRPEALALLPKGVRGVLTDACQEVAGADLVVDCTGQAEGLALATRLVRPRGTVVLKTTTHLPAQASPNAWVIHEVTVVGSRCGPFEPALRLLERGLVDPTPLITARYALNDGLAALERAACPGALKVLIAP